MEAEDGSGAPGHPETAPYVTTPGRSRNMAAIRRRDTQPEVRLRSALHRLGYRFRKDYRIRVNGKLLRPDIAFTRRLVAVFIDGCFWHSCPEHGRQPAANGEYWSPKLAGNARRDRDQTATLQSAGWFVLRFWEHEEVDDVVAAIEQAITNSGKASAPAGRNHGADRRLRLMTKKGATDERARNAKAGPPLTITTAAAFLTTGG